MEQFAKVGTGTTLCYESFGEPDDPVLVLIAGYGSQMGWWRLEFIQGLVDRGLQVIRFDNRDAGRSEHLPGAVYGLGDMADDVAGLITALGADTAHVAGQSMGGMIAQELAIRHPTLVRSLVLISTGARVDAIKGEPGLAPVASTRAEAIELFMQSEGNCRSRDYPQDTDWVRQLAGSSYDRGYDPAGVDRQREAILTADDRLPALARLTMPTAVLVGTADLCIEPAASRDLAAAIPGAALTLFEGMGHELPAPLWPEIQEIIALTIARAN